MAWLLPVVRSWSSSREHSRTSEAGLFFNRTFHGACVIMVSVCRSLLRRRKSLSTPVVRVDPVRLHLAFTFGFDEICTRLQPTAPAGDGQQVGSRLGYMDLAGSAIGFHSCGQFCKNTRNVSQALRKQHFHALWIGLSTYLQRC